MPKKSLCPIIIWAYIQPAEDLDLWPCTTCPSAFSAQTMLHALHQPSKMTFVKLIMLSTRWREPKMRKPVEAIVVQIGASFLRRYFRTAYSLTYSESCSLDPDVQIYFPRAVKPLKSPWLSMPCNLYVSLPPAGVCALTLPFNRYYTGVYLLDFPSFCGFLTYQNAWKQARWGYGPLGPTEYQHSKTICIVSF